MNSPTPFPSLTATSPPLNHTQGAGKGEGGSSGMERIMEVEVAIGGKNRTLRVSAAFVRPLTSLSPVCPHRASGP